MALDSSLHRKSSEGTTACNLRNLQHVARSVGLILARALDCAESRLANEKQYALREAIRDEVKPVCDYLIHLDLASIEAPELPEANIIWHDDPSFDEEE